jgi:crotonobetainyl-CoA:carnitine CoA-transferase CaiB-like acyl-CoA transferase
MRDPQEMKPNLAGSLRGVRIVDFGQYIAGPLAAMMLADQGADVIHVDPPGGPAWKHPAAETLRRHADGTRIDLRARSGRDEALELIGGADVLIENFRPGVMDRLGVGSRDCLAANPRLVYCSIPGFASTDPRAGIAGWEGVVMAAAGAFERVDATTLLGSGWWPRDRPVWSPLPLASVFAGTLAALAIVAALIARERDGAGQHIEISAFAAMLEAMGARLVSYERAPRGGRPLGSGLYRCADGELVNFIATRAQHLERLAGAIGTEVLGEKLVDFDSLGADRELGRALGSRLVEIFATRTSAEWEATGIEAGVPIARMWPPAERGLPTAVTVRRTGGGVPRQIEPGLAPLSGTRVLDLTRVMAGPTAARLLAELGADVIKADSDPAGRRLGYREPLLHEHMNRGKRSVVMDLRSDDGRALLERLTSWADVVLTNFSLPAMRALGLTAADLQRVRPDLVHVYLNAFGTTGPWADRRGFAETVNASTGLTLRTLDVEAVPSGSAPQADFPRSPFTDYLGGVFAAFSAVTALFDGQRTGAGYAAETSLARAADYAQLPYMTGGSEPGLDSLGWHPLHRLYEAADGWVFIGADETALEEVESTIRSLPAEEVVTRLCRGRIAAHRSIDCSEVMRVGGSADLAGLRDVQLDSEFGEIVQPGTPFRFERTPVRTGRLPAPFGAEIDAVRSQLEPRRRS